MALYQHRFEGILPIGTRWGFGWWSESLASLDVIHADAVTWGQTAFDTTVLAMYDTSFEVQRIATSLIDQSTGVQQNLAESTVSLAGTTAGTSLSADMAICVTLRTATTSRRGRGRFYLPAGLTSQVEGDGRIAAATVSTWMTALIAAWTSYVDPGEPMIYSRTDRQLRSITTVDIGDLWDTQRRREAKAVQVRTTQTMPAA